MARPIRFEVLSTAAPGLAARRGRLTTLHGVIETPVFMPVGTLGAVKSLDPRDLDALGARICLANAYHLLLRPGADIVAARGGLHRFSGYGGAYLTDSGGFQIFSLPRYRKITDDGARFRSHIDGTLIDLSPERLVAVQEQLGPDIAMVLDECPPAHAPEAVVARAVDRTTAWARRCLAARRRDDVAWFGIVQGALSQELRLRHAATLSDMPFDGFAIGGVSVGEATADIDRIVKVTAPALPAEKPRYLMGVGTPRDLVWAVAAGVDMFDCVLPTRNARNGTLFTSRGRLALKNAVHRDSDEPVDPECPCYGCRHLSRSFLRHLYVARELSFYRLATLHNLTYYMGLMARIRRDLEAGRFDPVALSAAVS